MRKYAFVLPAMLFLLNMLYSKPMQYSYQDNFLEISEPQNANVTINPLDYSAKKIGQDIRNFPLPQGFRGQYRFCARYALIDMISNQPLYMKTWGESNQEYFQNNQAELKLKATTKALTELCSSEPFTYKMELGISDKEKYKTFLNDNSIPDELVTIISDYYEKFYSLQTFREEILGDLTEEDLEFLDENPGYYLAPDALKIASITGNVSTHLEYIRLARKVDFETLFNTSRMFYELSQELIENLNAYVENNPQITIEKQLTYDSPYGKVIIGSSGDDVYPQNAILIIDFNGNDTYTNNAGSTYGTDCSFALSFDINGNDFYVTKESYTQGTGFLGTGILADLSGNDKYIANHFSQGAGILGVGILYDESGDDSLSANTFCQGAAIFGCGLVLENGGNDIYDGASLCQGGASCLGLGMLSDISGNDKYLLNISEGKNTMGSAGYGQGGGLSFRHYPWRNTFTPYGGVGVLFDHNGNDHYQTSGWCDQGGSYIMSFGCLVDGNGDDTYIANTGQGSSIHITNAILIDKAGNDTYKGGFRSGASGSDHSPGILIDYSGNDIYNAGKACYGTGCKPWNLSLFIDYDGDDTYNTNNPKEKVTFNNWDSFGGVWPESEPYNWAYSAFLDLGGNDSFNARNKKNNSETSSFGHGIFLDMEYNFNDVIGDVDNPYPSYIVPDLSNIPQEHLALINGLNNGNNFSQFMAIGKISEYGQEIVPSLVKCILSSDEKYRLFNRNIMECIDYYLINDTLTDESVQAIGQLLTAADEETRILIADDIGFWKIKGLEPQLLKTAKADESSFVRQNAIRSLIRLDYTNAFSAMFDIALNDPSPRVRRLAVAYFSNIDLEQTDDQLLDFYSTVIKADSSAEVRIAAIDGIGKYRLKAALPLLYKMSDHFDFYIKRASANAIAQLGDIKGVELLIESLSFASIDAFENYNRNVPNSIASYTGHDFDESQRYDIEVWRKWFAENKDKIDLEYNLNLKREFDKVKSASTKADTFDEKVELYESYLKNFPDNDVAKNELAALLNSKAWEMVTSDVNSPEFNPEKGLKYAKRAVELSDSELNILDTLAEAYLANKDYKNSREICEKHKDNSMFKKRLEIIEELESQSK